MHAHHPQLRLCLALRWPDLARSRGGWLVEGPLAESPAEENGILAGQRLVEIDGYPADLLTPLEVAAL